MCGCGERLTCELHRDSHSDWRLGERSRGDPAGWTVETTLLAPTRRLRVLACGSSTCSGLSVMRRVQHQAWHGHCVACWCRVRTTSGHAEDKRSNGPRTFGGGHMQEQLHCAQPPCFRLVRGACLGRQPQTRAQPAAKFRFGAASFSSCSLIMLPRCMLEGAASAPAMRFGLLRRSRPELLCEHGAAEPASASWHLRPGMQHAAARRPSMRERSRTGGAASRSPGSTDARRPTPALACAARPMRAVITRSTQNRMQGERGITPARRLGRAAST
jgi:hypothetical protein